MYDCSNQRVLFAYKFTGKERDAESGLDNFGARYNSSSMGRFMSADPLLNSGRPWNPQSWNRYSYTENNPLRYTDPTGLFKWGTCQVEEICEADKERFRDSLKKLKDAAAGLPEASKERKNLEKLIKKVGEEGKGNIRVSFGDAGNALGVMLFPGKYGEHAAYFSESLTYQGLHNTDKPFQLWNESWLTVDKDKVSLEGNRERAIQNAMHPKGQKQENPQ